MSTALAADGDVSNEALLKKMEQMEQRIQTLEAELKEKRAASPAKTTEIADKPARSPLASAAGAASPKSDAASVKNAKAAAADALPDSRANKDDGAKKEVAAAKVAPKPELKPLDPATPPADKPILGLEPSPVAGLSIGAYGEVKFGGMQNPAAGGAWQNGFDTARMVLLPTYAITDNIIFNAEIEFEHAGSGFDNDDKLHGTAEIEQLWIDFKIIDQFNWRAPGIDLVPIGYINQHHEPTQFYSVNRPELYNGLIPSTWKVPGTSVYGTITDGLKYQVMLSTSNEDYGDSFDNRTAAKTVPLPGTPYAAGIDGINALGFSNPPLGDFQQLSDVMAVSGRLDFTPSFAPGFAGSASAYYSPNVVPRGAHDDFGNYLGRSSMNMFDAEFRYRVPDTGLELRGEYVRVGFGNPAALRANNDTDPTDNVGKSMWGYSGEVAYHVPMGTILNSDWEAVPFYRYTYENLQTGGFAGTDANTPTGQGQRQYHTVGLAIFPSPKLALKATYQRIIDKSLTGALSDSFLGGVGFFF
ncbi:MAG TPA: hypothetical protein VFB02_18290 [Bradyrhizobium sp.]|nr:hypothetical protein [Bradyrhizobium sp.]